MDVATQLFSYSVYDLIEMGQGFRLLELYMRAKQSINQQLIMPFVQS